jgi:hypothetical protein
MACFPTIVAVSRSLWDVSSSSLLNTLSSTFTNLLRIGKEIWSPCTCKMSLRNTTTQEIGIWTHGLLSHQEV